MHVRCLCLTAQLYLYAEVAEFLTGVVNPIHISKAENRSRWYTRNTCYTRVTLKIVLIGVLHLNVKPCLNTRFLKNTTTGKQSVPQVKKKRLQFSLNIISGLNLMYLS